MNTYTETDIKQAKKALIGAQIMLEKLNNKYPINKSELSIAYSSIKKIVDTEVTQLEQLLDFGVCDRDVSNIKKG